MSVYVRDIWFSPEFLEEYQNLPKRVRKQVDAKTRLISESAVLPPSFQAHRVEGSDLWIGYVNQGPNGYRILFSFNGDGTITFEKVCGHNEMDEYLREA
ncbi:MAG TPA: hypothetical protein PKD55_00360 [Bellilinea sp.]|nr:hypothetical protein [Bellilinea sp.]